MALGFSHDKLMPNTDVIGCQKSDADTANAQDTFNTGLMNYIDSDNSTLSNFTYMIDANFFSCAFNRDYLPQDSSEGFSLNSTTFYLFSATGTSFSPVTSRFERHSLNPCISDGKIDPLAMNVTSSSPDYSLVRAHGLLMLLAWSVFIVALAEQI